MEHTTVTPTGFLTCAFVLLQHNGAKRFAWVPSPQFPGEGAPNNPGTYNTDVKRIHLAWLVGSNKRRRSLG